MMRVFDTRAAYIAWLQGPDYESGAVVGLHFDMGVSLWDLSDRLIQLAAVSVEAQTAALLRQRARLVDRHNGLTQLLHANDASTAKIDAELVNLKLKITEKKA